MNNDAYANEDATQELLRISKWPEPLRLAYLLEKEMQWPLHGRAADELRRLHEVNQELVQALKIARDQVVDDEYQPIGWGVSRLDEILAKAGVRP